MGSNTYKEQVAAVRQKALREGASLIPSEERQKTVQWKTNKTFWNDIEHIEKLGKGAFGTVHRVRKNGVDYALKVMDKVDSDTKNEILVLEEITRRGCYRGTVCYEAHFIIPPNGHSNPYNVGTMPKHAVLMEFIDGEDLFDLSDRVLQREVPVPDDALRSILTSGLESLAHIHSLGVAHRDIKPENIKLVLQTSTSKPSVVLVDFGLSCFFARGKAPYCSRADWVGTACYLAPERLPHIEIPPEAQRAGDVWALAVSLYPLATGREFPPCLANDYRSMFRAIAELNRRPDQLTSTDASVDKVLRHMLEPDWHKRWTAARALRELRNIPGPSSRTG